MIRPVSVAIHIHRAVQNIHHHSRRLEHDIYNNTIRASQPPRILDRQTPLRPPQHQIKKRPHQEHRHICRRIFIRITEPEEEFEGSVGQCEGLGHESAVCGLADGVEHAEVEALDFVDGGVDVVEVVFAVDDEPPAAWEGGDSAAFVEVKVHVSVGSYSVGVADRKGIDLRVGPW